MSDASPPQLFGVPMHVYPTRETAYAAIVRTIAQVAGEEPGHKDILVAALHGHSGDRLADPQPDVPAFHAYDAALFACIKSSGPRMWTVKELYNIVTAQRLDQVKEWLRATANDDGYEVHAFCMPGAIPHLAPLVIGSRDVFLGLEDARYYRVRAALHIRCERTAALVRDYFNALWTDRAAHILRSGAGVQENALGNLSVAIGGTKLAFMAMDFQHSAELDTIFYDHFKPAVAQTGFDLRRIDESPPAGSIDNRLRLEIRRSRFAVVDLTYNNPGAYWEAGLAEGVGRPIFFTCKKGETVHFDTRQSYIIFWEPDKLPEAAKRLKEAIRVTIPEAKQGDE